MAKIVDDAEDRDRTIGSDSDPEGDGAFDVQLTCFVGVLRPGFVDDLGLCTLEWRDGRGGLWQGLWGDRLSEVDLSGDRGGACSTGDPVGNASDRSQTGAMDGAADTPLPRLTLVAEGPLPLPAAPLRPRPRLTSATDGP